jgi:hypothetical protein
MARADLGTPSAVQKTATSDSNRIVRFGSKATNGERPSVFTEEVVGRFVQPAETLGWTIFDRLRRRDWKRHR